MKTSHFVLGTSRGGLPIPAFEFGSEGPRVLILGGVHGDEIEGIVAAYGLYEKFCKDFSYRLRLTLVPLFNIDGSLHRTRSNAAGVDLNRNLPTQDWSSEVANPRYHPGPAAGSEPENQALVSYLKSEKPQFILSLHSWFPVLNYNGDSRPEAEEIAKFVGYKVEPTIGYPTPGSLGTYGTEQGLPVLTYEVERGLSENLILEKHIPAILAALHVTEKRFK
jgi:protein MpaA